MDSLIAASARALAAGDALGALKHVALRNDPPALALRGIAMAQLGELPRARELLRLAARSFGPHEKVARARCVVAEAEVALAMRDLGGTPRTLNAAAATLLAAADTLDTHADHGNAQHARLILARRLLLLGRLAEASAALTLVDTQDLPASLAAAALLTGAELALRSLDTVQARAALSHAKAAARRAGVPALQAEIEQAAASLERPAARLMDKDGALLLRLEDVEALLASSTLVIDACRRGVAAGTTWLPLARRPILFALARALAEAWPGDADREALIAQAFRTTRPDETHRARLRVEIGRLRALIKPVAAIEATARGFILKPHEDTGGAGVRVAMIAPPIDGEQASLLALLSDGAAWSTSALALALDTSQRTVQRALAELEEEGRVRAVGQARARRWLAPPLAGFTTILLLPQSLPLS